MKIIFAQGNPDTQYKKTRHNTGFAVLDKLGDDLDALWNNNDKFNARIGQATVNGDKVLLVKPLTFYNETGTVARRLIDFYKLDPSQDLLVIHDDLSLPFGTIRIREKGSDAGNNGIKNLNSHIGESYPRIRIGIWSEDRDRMDDADFVLSNFSRHEQKELEKSIIPHTIKLVEAFLKGKLEASSDRLLS